MKQRVKTASAGRWEKDDEQAPGLDVFLEPSGNQSPLTPNPHQRHLSCM